MGLFEGTAPAMRAPHLVRCGRVAGRAAISFALAASALMCAPAGAMQVASSELAELSLEQLSSIVVTSVSRRQERLLDAPASVFVISAEDIRRSGATSIPEALRLAPNLDVARADTNQYAISARGFNNVLANKMLVLIDGRTVYTPLFSGVFWEAQDVLLEDVDRIEVISGPGAALWGANAVNGVINVITKGTRETQGSLVTGGIGNRESGAAVRHGGTLAPDAFYRVYATYDRRDDSDLQNGTSMRDSSMRYQAGFRTDLQRGVDELTLQGDAYHADIDQAPATRRIGGANVLGRWTRDLSGGSAVRVQAYFDYTTREHPESFHENLGTLDVEGDYTLAPLGAHKVLVGAGYRQAWDRVTNSVSQAFLPAERNLHWAHVFVHDDVGLSSDVTLTVGAKVETNIYTGAEFLPNVRVAWRLEHDRLLWAALSRAVRAPSRIDRDFYVPGVAPFVLVANDTFRSEVANVAEVGFRGQWAERLSYSVTGFYQDYDRLRSYEPGAPMPTWGNLAEGWTGGVEGWATLRVTPSWRIAAGGVAIREKLRLEAGSTDPGAGLASLGDDPSAWWSVRSLLDIAPAYELDLAVRHVGPRSAVPGYTAVDARLGWKVSPRLRLSLVGQNLADSGHAEWGTTPNRAEFGRTVFFKVSWQP